MANIFAVNFRGNSVQAEFWMGIGLVKLQWVFECETGCTDRRRETDDWMDMGVLVGGLISERGVSWTDGEIKEHGKAIAYIPVHQFSNLFFSFVSCRTS
jgi:hypothetical protein